MRRCEKPILWESTYMNSPPLQLLPPPPVPPPPFPRPKTPLMANSSKVSLPITSISSLSCSLFVTPRHSHSPAFEAGLQAGRKEGGADCLLRPATHCLPSFPVVWLSLPCSVSTRPPPPLFFKNLQILMVLAISSDVTPQRCVKCFLDFLCRKVKKFMIY